MFNPLRAGWLRMAFGVSPCGTCHVISPRSRLIAVSVPYGGFVRGRPWTLRPPSSPSAALFVGGAFPALVPVPAAFSSTNGRPAIPEPYRISENPGGIGAIDFESPVSDDCA